MIKTKYEQGARDALKHLKLGNAQMGAAGYNPTLTGQAGTGAPSTTAPTAPQPAAPAIAAGAAKAKVLG
ncbi:MAG TPA: hypothetical protein VIV09_00990 [Pseudolabrys sp.]